MNTIKEVIIGNNEFATVYSNKVQFKNGLIGTHFKEFSGNGSTVLPITTDGQFILVSSFKYAQGEYVIELPKGYSEPDEDHLGTALRKLNEETGYTTNLLTHFTSSPSTSSIIVGKSEDYIAWDCVKTEGKLEQDFREKIELIYKFKPSELLEKILSNDIKVPHSTTFILKFFASFYPLKPQELDGKSSNFIMGMYNAATGRSENYNPFRNTDKQTKAYLEWKDGWKFFNNTVVSVVINL